MPDARFPDRTGAAASTGPVVTNDQVVPLLEVVAHQLALAGRDQAGAQQLTKVVGELVESQRELVDTQRALMRKLDLLAETIGTSTPVRTPPSSPNPSPPPASGEGDPLEDEGFEDRVWATRVSAPWPWRTEA